jgi:hypothetical protein
VDGTANAVHRKMREGSGQPRQRGSATLQTCIAGALQVRLAQPSESGKHPLRIWRSTIPQVWRPAPFPAANGFTVSFFVTLDNFAIVPGTGFPKQLRGIQFTVIEDVELLDWIR